MLPKLPKSHGKTIIGAVFIDLGSDGDQLIVAPTKDGGIVIIHIPPLQPVTSELTNVEGVLVNKGEITAQQISDHFRSSAATGQEVLSAIAMFGE